MRSVRAAASIVIGIFVAAFTVSFWPAARPSMPIAPDGAPPPVPMSLSLPAPAVVPVVRRPRVGRVEQPRPDDVRDLSMVVAVPVATPPLATRALTIDMFATPAVLMADEQSEPSQPQGQVTRAVSTAGRQISGAFRTAGRSIRAAF